MATTLIYRRKQERGGAVWGVALAATVAAVALGLHHFPKLGIFSALILAIVLGITVGNTATIPVSWRAGTQFCLKRVLRVSIILLGLQLSFTQVGQIGVRGMAVVAGSMVGTFLFTIWLGAHLGVDRKLAQLIAAGSSICGASAVIAANVVTEGCDEDVAYGVAVVTVFGSISMLVYPLLPRVLHLTPAAFGLWTGASIHEVAQVIAAAFQDGAVSGQFGTISKLARVMLLAPTVLTLGLLSARRDSDKGARLDWRSIPIPWFVLGFIAMIGVNTLNIIPLEIKTALLSVNQFLLALSLAAMGLETSLAKLKQAGIRPMLLGAGAWLFIAALSYGLVRLLY